MIRSFIGNTLKSNNNIRNNTFHLRSLSALPTVSKFASCDKRLFSSSSSSSSSVASSSATSNKDGNGHSDFETKSKVQVSSDDEVQEFLKQAVKEHPVLLFMKGTPESPKCGFSKRVVDMLVGLDVDFSSADVLASAEIREGIKKFSDWPTLPQLYVDGNFIGGCDIVTDMHSQGQLKPLVSKYIRNGNKSQ